jgi:uncharacterized protein YecE (DUF72 family)
MGYATTAATSSSRRSTLRIGISGWRYPGWRRVFYPPGLAQRRELEFAAEQFDSIEINGSFYSLQRPESYRSWYAATPPDFVFSVKGGRFITHMKKLRDIEGPLANFFASGVLELKEKLGPILWQFPENLGFTDTRFDDFFHLLPRDFSAAEKLLRKQGRKAPPIRQRRAIRHAVEVRSKSFCSPRFIDLARRHRIALVVADSAGRWPYFEDVTADFMYLRLHGDVELYTSGYSRRAIERWADRIRAWQSGSEPADTVRASTRPPPQRRNRDVYVYFDNDAKVHAPFDAMALSEVLRPSGQALRQRRLPAKSRVSREARRLEMLARWR